MKRSNENDNSSDKPVQEARLQSFASQDSHGWHVLLGEKIGGKLLCVETFSGEHSEFFRQLGNDVDSLDVSIHDGGSTQISLIDRVSQLLESKWRTSGEIAVYDGFVLHDLAGKLLNQPTTESILRLSEVVYQLLKPGGFCYIGFLNSRAHFSQKKLRQAIANHRLTLRPAVIRRTLVRAGFCEVGTKFYPYLLENEAILEILPERGYTSVKNSTLLREKFKEWCYGRFGARYWAPAYGAIAFKAYAAPSIVERIAQRLGQLPGHLDKNLRMFRCQFLLRKIIFSFGAGEEKYGQLVVVYTCDVQAIARRVAESKVLMRLAKQFPALMEQLPRFIWHGSLGKYQYFALSEVPGMTIDRPCPGTEIAKCNATSWLIKLHRSTSMWCKDSQETFDRLVGSLFQFAIDRYPALHVDIEQIEQGVRQRALGRDWLTVWQHGDFKLENLILDPNSFSIVGVIDWELSNEHGLPLLDILYLVVYGRSVELSMAQEDVYIAEVLPWKFTQPDQRLIDKYLASICLSLNDTVMWAAIFLIHNIGIRRHYDIDNPRDSMMLKKMLRETIKALELPRIVDAKDSPNFIVEEQGS